MSTQIKESLKIYDSLGNFKVEVYITFGNQIVFDGGDEPSYIFLEFSKEDWIDITTFVSKQLQTA